MKSALFSRLKKQFKKPLYKVLLTLLGLPTFLVGGIFYCFYMKKEKEGNVRLRKQIIDELESNGAFTKIENECKELLVHKFNFFGKNINSREFEKNLKKQVFISHEEAIEKAITENQHKSGLTKSVDFLSYLVNALDSPVLFALSVISSFPMYILLIICLNYFVRYSFERIIMMVFVIFGVVLLVFTILHFSSFDPARNILGETASAEQIARFNEAYGLDKPYIVQLFSWFKRIITFDLGNSYSSNASVLTALIRRFPTTLKLVTLAIAFGLVIAVPLGIVSALKANSGVDYFAMFLAMILMSMPSFWIGMILILNFAIKAGWVPATFDVSNAITYILPAMTISFALLAFTTRMTRSSMLEVSRQDYVMTARAKGLSNRTVVFRHMFSNALIPIITAASLQIGRMFGGSAVEERVYAVQGIGNYVSSAVYVPDIPVVIACVVYMSIIVSFVNLIVDLLYAVLDPTVKASLKKS